VGRGGAEPRKEYKTRSVPLDLTSTQCEILVRREKASVWDRQDEKTRGAPEVLDDQLLKFGLCDHECIVVTASDRSEDAPDLNPVGFARESHGRKSSPAGAARDAEWN
jgi:hypothetical protein